MSKLKGALSPYEWVFFNALSNRTSFYFSLSSGRNGAEAWTSAVVLDIAGCCVSWEIWLYCCKYYFSDRVPTDWETAGCAAKASFSSSSSLREGTITVSSSIASKRTLHDLSLSLSLQDLIAYLWRFLDRPMISLDFVVTGTRRLASCLSTIGLMTSSLASWTEDNPSWIVIFGKIPKLRVTILAVTFFYSDLRVRTPTFTNAWILSLRTKYLLVGWCAIL